MVLVLFRETHAHGTRAQLGQCGAVRRMKNFALETLEGQKIMQLFFLAIRTHVTRAITIHDIVILSVSRLQMNRLANVWRLVFQNRRHLLGVISEVYRRHFTVPSPESCPQCGSLRFGNHGFQKWSRSAASNVSSHLEPTSNYLLSCL
jgi:hypothetical protein